MSHSYKESTENATGLQVIICVSSSKFKKIFHQPHWLQKKKKEVQKGNKIYQITSLSNFYLNQAMFEEIIEYFTPDSRVWPSKHRVYLLHACHTYTYIHSSK